MKGPKSFLVLLTQWVWLAGLGAQIAGVCLQAAALDRGRVSIIQPLLVTTVIFAIPLGYFLTGQEITRRVVLGAAIIVVGLAVFASFADPAAGVDDAPGSDWVMSVIVIGAVCVALLLFANRGSLTARAATLGTLAGVLYGLSATLMKPVVENLHTEGFGAVLSEWEVWVMAVAGIVGFLVQQLSLSTGRLVASVATVSVANPVVSVMLGALVLQEAFNKNPPWHAVVGVGGLALALLGAIVISSVQEQEKKVDAETGAPPLPSAAAPGEKLTLREAGRARRRRGEGRRRARSRQLGQSRSPRATLPSGVSSSRLGSQRACKGRPAARRVRSRQRCRGRPARSPRRPGGPRQRSMRRRAP